MTLKEIRVQNNLRQSDIADLLKTDVPKVSNIENNLTLPDLEDMILLQKHFKQVIDWNEGSITPLEKHTVIQATIELLQRFPINTVCDFISRTYRKQRNPEKIIKFYANQISDDIEPLMMTINKF